MERSVLPEFIESHVNQLVELWLQNLPEEVFEPETIQKRTREYLENAIPDILKTIARVLRDPTERHSIQHFENLSQEHVEQRVKYFNISFSQLVKEYSVLRTTILKHYSKKCRLSNTDIFQMNKILDSALCQASSVYLEKKFEKSSRELRRENQQMVEKIAGLENFTAVAAHDLRAPLSTITSYLNLLHSELEKESDKPELKLFLQKAEDTAAKLLASLDAVLRFSRAELDKTEVSLNSILETAISNLDETIAAHNTEVIVEADLPVINVDTGMMAIVFQNIIANAIKYRSEKPPTIRIYAQQTEKKVKICFEDNGIGVAEKDLEKIFQPFTRLNTDSTTTNGLGLGLSTCRQIVQRHNGSIWAESDGNGGARFWIELPL